MNIEEYNELTKSSPVVIAKFSTSWCAPCKSVQATLDKIEPTIDDLKVLKIDAEEEVELSQAFQIRSVPVLLYYKDGELKDKTVGSVSEQTIREKIDLLKG